MADNRSNNMKVLIVGGGASGMMAAITAALKGAQVTIYEHNSVLGKKILATGNGKCNLTNRNLRLDCYNSEHRDKLNNYFYKFDSEDTLSIFKSFGLLLKEKDGYIYPITDQASSVRDILRLKLIELGVEVELEARVSEISKKENGFLVVSNKGRDLFDKVILACGSYAGLRKNERIPSDVDGYSLAYHLGHKIIPIKPALTQILCKENYLKEISGVRIEALISLMDGDDVKDTEYGELQFTEFGVSGIPAFQLSRHIARNTSSNYSLHIDFMPDMDMDELVSFLRMRALSYYGMRVEDFFLGIINSKISSLIIKILNFDPEGIIEEDSDIDALVMASELLKDFVFIPKGTKSFENAQCCSGGVSIDEIDDNCESKICKDLYLVGEMLDVDGKCGGYNLQWAWTTGYIAGRAVMTPN